MSKVIEDISALTTIPAGSLNRLVEKAMYCICNDVEEESLKGNNLTTVDLGMGDLQILVDGNDVKFRFVPSRKFEAAVRATILEGKNPLTSKVEQTLARRITEAYKSFI